MSVYDPGSRFTRTPGRGFDLGNDHPGVDWWADVGTRIPVAAAGTVVGLGFEERYGNIAIVRHPSSSEPPYRYTLYAHMEATQPVTLGAQVSRGQTIGYVDRTGSGAGDEPHLHFELVSLSEFTWESEWTRYNERTGGTWSGGGVPLMLTGKQGRIDPLLDTSWTGIDVYFPPPHRWGRNIPY